MIRYFQGDLVELSKTEPGLYLHGCNAQGIMGAGVAKQFKEAYPENYEAYKDHCDLYRGSMPAETDIMGTYVPWSVNGREDVNEIVIINMITQRYYGPAGHRWVSYDAVDVAMQKFFMRHTARRKADGFSLPVRMPMIGCGLGGGEWRIVSAIIENAALTQQVGEGVIEVWSK